MMHSFPELTIGGVFIAPFVIYAGAAIAIFAVLRPFLHLVGFDRAFSSAPIAALVMTSAQRICCTMSSPMRTENRSATTLPVLERVLPENFLHVGAMAVGR